MSSLFNEICFSKSQLIKKKLVLNTDIDYLFMLLSFLYNHSVEE